MVSNQASRWDALRQAIFPHPSRMGAVLGRVVALVLAGLMVAPVYAAGRQNVEVVWSNSTPLGGYSLGDFDGDGRTDLFRVVGTQWQFSSGGTGVWQNLASDPTPHSELRFGDFNGDGRTDVFSRLSDGRWRYSPGGASNWVLLTADPAPLSELRFGDFNGDGITDVFSVAADGRWRYSAGGAAAWTNLAIDTLTINDLRFGYFNDDSRMDVFSRAADGRWRFSAGGTENWQNLWIDPAPLNELALGDFNGDGITDVFHRTASGQWRYSPSGTGPWLALANDPLPLSELRFGDFNGDNITDVFSIGPDNVPRYSAGGVGAWQPLAPIPAPTPTPTPPGPATPITALEFGDFDGDGITDVFRSNGGQWQFSPRGVGDWVNLAYDPLPLSELRFHNFNGDALTDVFSVAPNGRWRYSSGGTSSWIDLMQESLTLDELRFGDFDGDGRTDVFSRDVHGQWRYSSAGLTGWNNLAADPLPLGDLRFGDFDGNGRTDVFSVAPNGQWRYSADGTSNWINLRQDSLHVSELRFGDFDGDGRTDVFSRAADGRWRYASAGQGDWINLAYDPLPLSELRFGDFNGDGRTDVFSIAPDGRWRYSSAGQSNWILIGPPGFVTTPTPTPIVTRPTGMPPGGPSCPNLLDNGDFELNRGWTFGQSPIPGKYSGAQHKSGIRSVLLGNAPESNEQPKASYSSIRQLVSVPSNAGTVTLRWWRLAKSDKGAAASPSNTQDRHEVILLGPGGQTLKILERVRLNDPGWQPMSVDLTEFAGMSFYVYFNVYTDGSPARTWMYLDDVRLEVCGGGGGPGYGPGGKPNVGPGGPPSGPGYGPSYGPDSGPGYGPGGPSSYTDDYYDDYYGDYTGKVDPAPMGYGPGGYEDSPAPSSVTVYRGPTRTSDSVTATPTATPTPTATNDVVIEDKGGSDGVETPTPTLTPTGDGGVGPAAPDVPASLSSDAPLQRAVHTPRPTVLAPAECIELVNNGNFEVADTGWTVLYSPAMPAYVTDLTFNRSRQAMRLGITDGENRAAISAIDQIVTLPEDVSSIILSLRYYPILDGTPSEGDIQVVDLYHAVTGQFAGRVFGLQSDEQTWLTTDYDLTPLAGQSIRLVISVNNDGEAGQAALIVDNVSILACQFSNLVRPPAEENPAVSVLPATSPAVGNVSRDTLLPGEWSSRLGAFGVLTGILAAIGFAATVIFQTMRQPD